MKEGIHPDNYRLVIFKDMSNGHSFLCRSCAPTKDKETWEDGKEYPLVKLEISSQSHPFFTGKMQYVDTAGRIDKFKNRYGDRKKKKADAGSATAEKPKETKAQPNPEADTKVEAKAKEEAKSNKEETKSQDEANSDKKEE